MIFVQGKTSAQFFIMIPIQYHIKNVINFHVLHDLVFISMLFRQVSAFCYRCSVCMYFRGPKSLISWYKRSVFLFFLAIESADWWKFALTHCMRLFSSSFYCVVSFSLFGLFLSRFSFGGDIKRELNDWSWFSSSFFVSQSQNTGHTKWNNGICLCQAHSLALTVKHFCR